MSATSLSKYYGESDFLTPDNQCVESVPCAIETHCLHTLNIDNDTGLDVRIQSQYPRDISHTINTSSHPIKAMANFIFHLKGLKATLLVMLVLLLACPNTILAQNDLMVGNAAGVGIGYDETGTPGNPSWTATPIWNSPNQGEAIATSTGDLNGDGILDLIVGTNSGLLNAYRNTGSYASPIWTLEGAWSIAVSETGLRPLLVDIDNDGDLDLFYGASNGEVIALENIGTALAPAWQNNSTWSFSAIGLDAAPTAADLDCDGDFDLLIGYLDGIVRGVENIGSASSANWAANSGWDTPDLGSNAVPACSDLDGDSDPDLLVGESSGFVYGLENTCGGAAISWTPIPSWDFHSGAPNSCPSFRQVASICDPTPSISCIGDQTYSCPQGIDDYTDDVTAGDTDNCSDGGALTIVQCPAPGVWIAEDTYVSVTVTDEDGYSNSCWFWVIVDDTTSPTISCPSDQTIALDANCEYQVPDYLGIAAVSDDCDATPTYWQFPAAGTTMTVDATVTLYAQDASGNFTSCTFDITATPGAICNATGGCSVTLGDYTGLVSVSDDTDSNPVIWQIPEAGTVVYSDTQINVFTMDSAGNISSCAFNISVQDSVDPTISCPGDQNVAFDALCQFTVPDYTSLASASDNCDALLEISQSPSVGTVVSGQTTITLTATDNYGNSADCSFELIPSDSEDPVITTCPPDVTEFVNSDCEFDLDDYTSLAAATDNCDTDVSLMQSPAPGTTIFGYSTVQTVTITATDDAGNSSTCSFQVTLDDDIDPTILCPGPVTANTDPGLCAASGVSLGVPSPSDNCGVASTSNDAPAAFSIGDTIVTWTVVDDAGNTNTCEQTVTVIDLEAPSITCPADITVNVDPGSCDAFVNVSTPSALDNCTVDTVINDFNSTADASDTYPVGTTTVVWTVTDLSGNTAQCSMTITVIDNENPVADCQDITVSLDATGSVTILAADIDGGSTDNCSITGMSVDQDTFNATGDYTVTLTVTDAAGNTDDCAATVTVIDNSDPTALCQDITVFLDASGNVSIVGLDVDNGSFDNGVIDSYDVTPDSFTCANVGDNLVTLTVTDEFGNIDSCAATVTVVDDIAPITLCQDLTVYLNGTGDVSILADDINNGSTDNCGIASLSIDVADFNCTNVGANTVVLTVTDVNGNSSSCSATVTVLDDLAPSITCPTDITVDADPGVCQANITIPAPAVGDNCTVDYFENDFNSTDDASGIYPMGTTEVVWTVFDIYGNSTSCSMFVTVNDVEAPLITCPGDQAVSADTNCEFTMLDYTGTALTTDNCDPAPIITQSPLPGSIVSGTTVVTLTSTDIYGNFSTCTFQVIVEDTTNPIIQTCANNSTEQLDSNCEFALPNYTNLVVVSDNCDTDVTVTQNPTPGTVFSGEGTVVTVTLTATDGSGNTDACTFDVTLQDSILPTITCPDNITQTTDPDVCEAAVTVAIPDTDDNCGVASIVNDYNNTNNASDVYPVGTTTVEWTVTDVAGNVQTCTMTITVTDDEAPSITCLDDITQIADAGSCTAAVIVPMPVTDDNCDVASVVNDYNNTDDAADTYSIGTTTVEWTVTDIHGNVTTCTMGITIIDDEIPTITCPDNITQTADNAVCDAMVTVPVPVADDNCGVLSVINDYNNTDNASDIYPVGTTTVEWTVTDLAGNTEVCTMTITVTDDEAPSITCPDDITQTTDNGVCEAMVTVPMPVTDDNCDVASAINNYNNTDDASDIYPVGTTTVEWTVTDIHGNLTTCTMSISVTDDEAPSITCPDDITQTADAGVCEALVTIPMPITDDNCAVANVVNDYNNTGDASGIYPVGTTEVEWTVTDIHGNVTTCTMAITVTDDEMPSIACPEDMVEFVDDNCEFDLPDYTGLVSTWDNCDVDIEIVQSPAPGTIISASGAVQTITMTAIDDAGNENTCTFNVTLDDEIAPTIVCPEDQTLSVDDNCELMIPDFTGLAVGADNCDSFTITQSLAVGTVVALGDYVITLTIEDPDGNQSSCDFNLSVVDTTPPVITCPETQVVEVNDECAYVLEDFTGIVIANDNCSDVFITQIPTPGTVLTTNTTIMVNVDDEHGNSTVCLFDVELIDTIDPVITCPEDISMTNDPGECGAIVHYELPVTSDNCGVVSLDLIEGLASGEFFAVGLTTVTYEVADGFGNTSTCSFSIEVLDEEQPMITCPEDLLVENDPGECGAVVAYIIDNYSDNCGVAEVNMLEGIASGEMFPVGETTLTYEVIDVHGNSTECSFSVTVEDTEAPVILACTEDIIQNNDPGECGATILITTPQVSDNCAVTDMYLNSPLSAADYYPVGTTTVTWEITDAAGNTTLCSFNVTIVDAEAPVIECPEDMIVPNDPGVCGAVMTYSDPNWTDNCGTATYEMTEGLASGELFPIGETVITFEIIDDAGNVSTCSFTVTVNDTEAPVIECPEDIVQIDPIVFYDMPIFSDNCSAEIEMIEGIESGYVFPHGFTTITFQVTDPAGNIALCSFDVLVNTPPIGEDDEADYLEEDEEITIDVLDNDWDPDGDEITLCGELEAQLGDVDIVDNQIVYTAPLDYCGMDTLTYVLCDEFGAMDTAQVAIQIECFIDLIIPQGFSPNNDGVNDTFEILGLEDYPGSRLQVFNRWGHKVFEATDYANDWGGESQSPLTIGNGLLPKGTYFFVLDLDGKGINPVKGYIFINY